MVIQRWQSVLLLIVAAMMGCLTFFSLGQVQLPEQSLDFSTLGFYIEGEATGGAPSGWFQHTWLFFIVSLLCCILPFVNIFLFKNLKLQKRVCVIEGFLLLAVVAIGCAYGYYNDAFPGYQVSWSSLIICWPIAFIADMLAYNRINADMKTLRAADRLR